MRVLWVNNIAVPEIAAKLGVPVSNREGWISGMMRKLSLVQEDIILASAFPVPVTIDNIGTTVRVGESDIQCYSFHEDIRNPEKVTPGIRERFQDIISDFKPDIVHIFGTEFYHSAAAAQAFGRPERTLIGLQGMMRAYENVYMGGLQRSDLGLPTLRDIVRMDGIGAQKRKFAIRADHEAEALRLTANVTGRTGFDRTEALKVNPDLNYYHMNETLRESFYSDSWSMQECVPDSIFVSQGYYPIKGLHFMLEAMPYILEEYPYTILRVAGDDVAALTPCEPNLQKKKLLRISSYGRYLRKLIKEKGLQNCVEMTGPLTEQEMKQEYLRANVFVCPSAIENSPNSLGEAMMLGVPCVASRVGGIPDMLDDGREGVLVPFGDARSLADAVKNMFLKSAVTTLYSMAAKKRSHITHDPDTNYKRLMEIYSELMAK
ncbi:MAG: glycosyltransferase family 4 protein [Lachnospiraceae bacterium]|nr:glycosyltransferase family 4 protein [Lachnospiraceae bacterium]